MIRNRIESQDGLWLDSDSVTREIADREQVESNDKSDLENMHKYESQVTRVEGTSNVVLNRCRQRWPAPDAHQLRSQVPKDMKIHEHKRKYLSIKNIPFLIDCAETITCHL
ncbi:hypothetical protein EVAR_11176_1 [Eumeta japonica]|uniref:Uncharacterized protein n=1 Tax=Eumeta variegata TaxID=151549 RepID=A0A4C1U429_EUMVA|nr:hypothetical protein EVAR_11176_1 [Eumeta japonica]